MANWKVEICLMKKPPEHKYSARTEFPWIAIDYIVVYSQYL